MDAYAYMPKNPTPFITSRKELPHRKPSAEHIEMRRFFATHDFVEIIDPKTGELDFKAVTKNDN